LLIVQTAAPLASPLARDQGRRIAAAENRALIGNDHVRKSAAAVGRM
jgi:hypothetical protein